MKVVWKYKVDNGISDLWMQQDAQILHCNVINNEVFMWALVNDTGLREKRTFALVATGESILHRIKDHVGTFVFNGDEVYHLFEV